MSFSKNKEKDMDEEADTEFAIRCKNLGEAIMDLLSKSNEKPEIMITVLIVIFVQIYIKQGFSEHEILESFRQHISQIFINKSESSNKIKK